MHPWTIGRDIRKLSGSTETVCPTCERAMTDRQWEQLEERQSRRAYNALAATRGVSEVA